MLNDIIEKSELLNGLIIEFHDVNKNMSLIKKFIESISLKLVHVHVNNYGDLYSENKPDVLELSFSKFGHNTYIKSDLPNEEDQNNNKDLLSMWRPASDSEDTLLQDVIDNVYDQFKQAFIESRKISREKATQLAQGQIYTGLQALDHDMIDKIGGYHDALTYIGELTNLGKNPHIIKKSNYGWKGIVNLLNIQIKNRLEILETKEPPERPSGIKVSSVDELVEKLKNEVGVI